MPPLIQILKKPPEVPPVIAERLRQYAFARKGTGACDFCGAGIEEAHGHLVDLPRRRLLCVCRPCYLLFTQDGAGGARFRAVPTRFAVVPEFGSREESWGALDLPIGLAFFFKSSATGRTTAFYPSPAGATESELPLESWEALTRRAPLLATLTADVEALLVRRASTGTTAIIVPIDICYELVGVIRVVWRGLQGGDGLSPAVDEFFARVIERAEARA